MVIDQKAIDEALDLKRLKLPNSLPVLALRAEDFTTWDGDETIRIHVLLDESADVDNISGEDVGELKYLIRDSLRKHGVTVLPIFKLAKPSELAASDDEG